ncbi:hypothetical protein PTKIN_Ptkin14bG0029100 [Pterospermum kingtungense]
MIHTRETENYADFQSLNVAVSHHLQTCWKKMAPNRTFLLAGNFAYINQVRLQKTSLTKMLHHPTENARDGPRFY